MVRNAPSVGDTPMRSTDLPDAETLMGPSHVGNGGNRETVYRDAASKTWLLWVKLDCLKSSDKLEPSPPSTPRLASSLGCSTIVFPSCEISHPGTWSMRPVTSRTDTLRQPENVTRDCTVGSPTRREAQGDGAAIVVGGVTSTHGDRESRLQGQVRQERWADEVVRYANAEC